MAWKPIDPGPWKPGKPKKEQWRWRKYIPRRGEKVQTMWNKRRRSGLRQKPWNKVTRMEKFWTVPSEVPNAAVYTAAQASTNAIQIVAITGASLAADQFNAAAGQRALQHAKLHRFDGYLWAWLAPNGSGASPGPTHLRGSYRLDDLADNLEQFGTGGIQLPPNLQMCTYVWLKLKATADAATFSVDRQSGTAGNWNPQPYLDLPNLLLRDDILRWGTLPVWGKVPEMYTQMQRAPSDDLDMASIVVGNAGMWMQNSVAKIPFPRLPKEGLNLKAGEVLACFIANWAGPANHSFDTLDDAQPVRDMIVYPQYRLLCSV